MTKDYLKGKQYDEEFIKNMQSLLEYSEPKINKIINSIKGNLVSDFEYPFFVSSVLYEFFGGFKDVDEAICSMKELFEALEKSLLLKNKQNNIGKE